MASTDHDRMGASPAAGWMAGSILLLVAMLLLLSRTDLSRSHDSTSKKHATTLQLYCASSNREVIEAVCREYKEQTGVSVVAQFGASQTLLATIRVVDSGDLFLPADVSYLEKARDLNLIERVFPVATMHVLAVVGNGNPKSIQTIDDLLRADVRLSIANPESAAIGKVTRDALAASDLYRKLTAAAETIRTSVTEVANDVKLGAADVGFIFDSMLTSYPDLQAIHFMELDAASADVGVAVLTASDHREDAIRFARFLSAADGGRPLYAKYGFTIR